MRLLVLSKRRKQGFSFEHFVCSTKCFRKSAKCTSFIHPEGFACPLLPGGPLIRKWLRKLTLGKIKYGGILFPVAETAQASVTRVPLSAEISDPWLHVNRKLTIEHVVTQSSYLMFEIAPLVLEVWTVWQLTRVTTYLTLPYCFVHRSSSWWCKVYRYKRRWSAYVQYSNVHLH